MSLGTMIIRRITNVYAKRFLFRYIHYSDVTKWT